MACSLKNHLLSAGGLLLALFLGLTPPVRVADAATLQVSGGQLTGATGVNIGGSFFDVEFLDGSCAGLFSGCNEASDFDFVTQPAAATAAQALLDQVFLDGALGNFDSDPELTRGCSIVEGCIVIIPYALASPTLLNVEISVNYDPAQAADLIDTSLADPSAAFDTHDYPYYVYAQFSPSDVVVPVPAALPLFLSGIAGLGVIASRRRRRPEA